MKLSSIRILMVSILCAASLVACGGGKYEDAKSIMSDQAKITENYVNGLEKAASAEDVAKVIDDFTTGMKDMLPKIKAYQKKYPELVAQHATVPSEVKNEAARLEAASVRIREASMKMMQYMMDPKVQQAMQRMGEELGGQQK